MNNTRLDAIVRGHVQGVSFRYYTYREARKLGVTGWVRNEADGSVRVSAEGTEAQLQQFLTFLEQGPLTAHVQDVEVTWSAAPPTYTHFEVRY